MDSLKHLKVMPKLCRSFEEPSQTYTLTSAQLQFYEDNGYLVLPALIDFSTLYSCKQRFIQISKGIVDKGQVTVMKEKSLINSGLKGEDLINKIQDILYDDVLSTYTENPRLLHVLSQFIGENITGMHSMLINKPPGTGEHPPHQDLYYFPFRPASRIIASWTAIDEVTSDNGCLYVIPGSHIPGVLYDHGYTTGADGTTNKMYHGILSPMAAPVDSRILLEMSPGDTVFFHPLLVHGSGPNVSKRYRKAISCHYAASDCHYIEVKGTNQEGIATEIEHTAKRRGLEIPFTEIWHLRSKQVRGVRSNL